MENGQCVQLNLMRTFSTYMQLNESNDSIRDIYKHLCEKVQETTERRSVEHKFALDALVKMEMQRRKMFSPMDVNVLGNTVAIHNTPKMFLNDVTKDTLADVARQLGTNYLGPSAVLSWPVQGKLFGINHRPLIALPVKFPKKCDYITLVFLVDTGAPMSCISKDVIDFVTPKGSNIQDQFYVLINGIRQQVNLSKDHYEDIHLIGADYLQTINCQLHLNYGMSSFTMKAQQQDELPLE